MVERPPCPWCGVSIDGVVFGMLLGGSSAVPCHDCGKAIPRDLLDL